MQFVNLMAFKLMKNRFAFLYKAYDKQMDVGEAVAVEEEVEETEDVTTKDVYEGTIKKPERRKKEKYYTLFSTDPTIET